MTKNVIFLLKAVLDDGDSFMILNAAVAVLIIGLSLWLSAFKKYTVVAYFISAISAVAFIIAEKSAVTEWNIIINAVLVLVPIFVLSSVVSIFCSVKNLYDKYFKN